MTSQQVLNDLKSKIPAGTSLKEVLTSFIRHFDETEVESCAQFDGDMLLYQWGGPYSWDSYFSVNLTRQFTFEDEDGEYDGMEQLQMNCRYEADALNLESGNEWFDGTDIEAFIQRVLSSDAVSMASAHVMQSLDFELGRVQNCAFC